MGRVAVVVEGVRQKLRGRQQRSARAKGEGRTIQEFERNLGERNDCDRSVKVK